MKSPTLSTRDPAHVSSDVVIQTAGDATGDAVQAVVPVRMLSGSGSDWERQLIASAALDQAPVASIVRLARALELPHNALPLAAQSGLGAGQLDIRRPDMGPADIEPPAMSSGLGAVSSFVKCVSLVGLAAIGWVVIVATRHSPAPQTEQRATVASVVSMAQASSTPASTAAVSASVPTPEPLLEPHAEFRAKPQPKVASNATNPTKPKRASDNLRAELSALENVQRALHAGEMSTASRALDDYATRFPRGELTLEAERLGADVARGERRDGANRAPSNIKERR